MMMLCKAPGNSPSCMLPRGMTMRNHATPIAQPGNTYGRSVRRAGIQALSRTAEAQPRMAVLQPKLDIPVSDIETAFEAPGTVLAIDGKDHGIMQVAFAVDGMTLAQHKGNILYLADQAGQGATDTEKALLLAMAMQETNHMADSERDASKDGKNGARNVSCFNLNVDMLNRAGWNGRNDDLQNVIQCLLKWMRGQVPDQASRPPDKHLFDTLNFVRGGYTYFSSGGTANSNDAKVYRNSIASVWRELRTDPTAPKYDDHQNIVPNPPDSYVDSKNLWANNTRIWIEVGWI